MPEDELKKILKITEEGDFALFDEIQGTRDDISALAKSIQKTLEQKQNMNDKRHNDDIIITELRVMKEYLMSELAHTKEQVKLLKEQIEKNGERIRVMELWQSNSMGKMAIIFTVIGMGVTALLGWASKHF